MTSNNIIYTTPQDAMHALVLSTVALLACTNGIAAPAAKNARQVSPYAGYLSASFTDIGP